MSTKQAWQCSVCGKPATVLTALGRPKRVLPVPITFCCKAPGEPLTESAEVKEERA